MGSVALKGVAADAAIGAEHICALLASGDAYCLGSARLGSLGPVDVGGRVVGIAVGEFTTCLPLKSGRLRC